jgi:transposase
MVVTINQLKSYVKKLNVKKSSKIKKESKRIKPFAKRVKRHKYISYSPEIRKLVVRVYFGGDLNGKPELTYARVAKIFNMPLMTVCYIVNAYRSSGCNIDAVAKKRTRFSMLSSDLQTKLMSEELLQEWVQHSIKERPALILNRFGVQLSARTLERFYRSK